MWSGAGLIMDIINAHVAPLRAHGVHMCQIAFYFILFLWIVLFDIDLKYVLL